MRRRSIGEWVTSDDLQEHVEDEGHEDKLKDENECNEGMEKEKKEEEKKVRKQLAFLPPPSPASPPPSAAHLKSMKSRSIKFHAFLFQGLHRPRSSCWLSSFGARCPTLA